MTAIDRKADVVCRPKSGKRSRLSAIARSRDGSAAIEFALLAIPYFMVIFAILETFIAFAGEELVSNAVDTLSRKMRTGQITYNLGRTATDMDKNAFRQAFCNEISILIKCSATEVATPSKLWIDVQTFTTFAAIPNTIPRLTSDPYSDLKTSAFKYTPGGTGTVNMVRAYYRWQVITDIIRPYITTVHPADGSSSYFLIIATAAFQNEQYP